MAKKIKFEEYDWNTWMKEVGSKLYFSGDNEEEALHRYKMKYFKTHVDPDFELPSSPSSSSSSPSNINSANQPNINNNNNSINNDNNKNNENNKGGAQQKSGGQERKGAQQRSGGFNLTQRLWTFASISVIMNSLLFYLPLLYWVFGYEFLEPKGGYNRALVSAVGVYLISLIYEIGYPSFTKEYFTKFAKSENTHYVSVCLVILALPAPIFLFLMPLALTQLYMLLKVLEQFPLFRKPIIQKIIEQQQYIVTYCSICEVVTFPLLFSMMIFGGGIQEAISCFVYFQFLQNRYLNSMFIRLIFQQLRIKILEITRYPIFPSFVSRSFEGLCSYLYRITTRQPA